MKEDKPVCPYHEMKAVGKNLLGENDPEALWKPSIIKHQREQEKRR